MTVPLKGQQMLLGAQNMLYGSSRSAWRMAEANATLYVDPAAWVENARWAEQGKFQFVFTADHPAIREEFSHSSPSATLDPVIVVS
jgi:alkanesulfonate monooxygenase SsuD/methylene tetrahydromethanopterin reductase-like flavin-dependent oxidoreductase (luciferase family)